MRWTEEQLSAYNARQLNAPAPSMTEAQLQTQVLEVAKRLGWHFRYHTFNSKRSAAGFPDLVLLKPSDETQHTPGRLVFAELKRDGEAPTLPQQLWLAALRDSVPGVEAYLWTPADLEMIVKILGEQRNG